MNNSTINLSILLTFLLHFYVTNSLEIHANKYKITNLNDRVGLYFNHMGDAKLSIGKYTLLTHFNLSITFQQFEQIVKYYRKTEPLCRLNDETNSYKHVTFHCKHSLELASSRINNTYKLLESIKHLTGHELPNGNRNKRGILNGISYAVNWLFGIPDADDAKYYDESIKSLLKDNRNTQLLMKQQISIISNAIQNFNASVANLKLNEKKFNENIEKFNELTLFATSAINELTFHRVLSNQLTLLTGLITDLHNYCDLLIESITLARHNILHPNVITPFELVNELNKITLKSGQRLPFPINLETINDYFTFAKLDSVYINDILIFAIKIPLIDEQSYILYEILPLPIPHPNSSMHSYIEPSSPYLLMSNTKVYYSPLRDLKTCTMVKSMEYICYNIMPTRLNDKPTCETTLLATTINRIPAMCNTKTIKAELEIWHKINDNNWLFAVSNSSLATLTCANSPIQDCAIKDIGLLELYPGCTAYTNNFMLHASTSYNHSYLHKSPAHKIIEDDCCVINANKSIPFIRLEPIKINNVRLDELSLANHKLSQLNNILQKELENPTTTIQHPSWFNSFLTFSGSILLLLVLWCLFKYCGLCKLILQCFKNPKQCCGSCCLKIFNTNINTPQVTQRQLDQIGSDTDDDSDDRQATRIPLRTITRRSQSRDPEISMN